jgi:hypothetical protein
MERFRRNVLAESLGRADRGEPSRGGLVVKADFFHFNRSNKYFKHRCPMHPEMHGNS